MGFQKIQARAYEEIKELLRRATRIEDTEISGRTIPRYMGEFWTSKQRQASSIAEISYRGCFKPQLPRFFVECLSRPNQVIYDPFSGRGTTVIEAGLLGRRIIANDANPLSAILARPRFAPPDLIQLEQRLAAAPVTSQTETEIDLSMFFHPETFQEIRNVRNYLEQKSNLGQEDEIDRWIRMVASNRLTGHSAGFFSVYNLPPNQAVSAESQIKINRRLRQTPPYRNTKEIILKKTRSLLRNLTDIQIRSLRRAGESAIFMTEDAGAVSQIPDETVQLTVTSPPFLDVVQYSKDNWLRCWFNNLSADAISKNITIAKNIQDWRAKMASVFQELFRITRRGGWVAFEVGEIRKRSVRLEEHVVPLGLETGFACAGIFINQQKFTKTANIWGIKNNSDGTNTNRIALFQKS